MKVGFIGIGQIGRQACECLFEAGYDLTVHDLRKEAAEPLLKKGAKWQDSPKSVAEACQIVLTSLPAPPQVEEVVYGPNGLATGWKAGDVYVDMTSSYPNTIRRVAVDANAKGVEVLDAAVSRGRRGDKMVLIVGGEASTVDRVHEVLEAIGYIHHVGGLGCGSIVKLINNMISATCSAITAEGFVLGAKAGIDVAKMWEVIKISTGNNWTLEHNYPQTVFQGNFSPATFRLNLHLKDVGLALALGKEYNVPLPVAAIVEQLLLEAKAAGFGEMQNSAVILPMEKLAGVQVRIPKA